MPVIAQPLPSKVSKSEKFTLNRDSWQAAGLVGWYPLGGYNDARDLSGFGNHGEHKTGDSGTSQGFHPLWSIEGRTAMSFDSNNNENIRLFTEGSPQGILSPNGAIDFSIMAWIYPGGAEVGQTGRGIGHSSQGKAVVSHTGNGTASGYHLGFSKPCCYSTHTPYFSIQSDASTAHSASLSSLKFGGSGDSDTTSAGPPNGVGWLFFVGTYNSGDGIVTCHLRGDGIVSDATTTSVPSTIFNSDNYSLSPRIGYRGQANAYPFAGLIDDVRMYYKPISLNEVNAIYENTRDGSYGDLARPARKLFHFSGQSNLAPTAVALNNAVNSLAENASTSSSTKIADIAVTEVDGGLGTNTLSLSGDDASSFEISGTELHLKAGVALDYEVKTSYAVTVEVDDDTVGSTPDLTVSHTLSITDVRDTVESKQITLVEGPSSEFDVVTEVRDERRGATGRGTFCPSGVVNASSFGTRSDPSTQAGLNRLDNRFVRGANQGDKIKSN